jgi:hypothetical protein
MAKDICGIFKIGVNMKKCCLLIALLMYGGACFANSSFATVGISTLIVHDSGDYIILGLSSPLVTNENCPNKNELVLKKSHPSFDQMYAAILSAFHANTEFKGWVDGCRESWGMPILTRIDLVK